MPITPKQIEQRKNYIGASDIAAIMGLSPWRTAYDIWTEKTGKLDDSKGTDATLAGQAFEKAILLLAEPQLGKLLLNQFRVLKGTHLASHCDSIVKETGRPAEAKLRRFDDGWGEPNTDQVPDDVIVQAQVQLLCTQKDFAHIIAVIAARAWKVQLFIVPFDTQIADIVRESAEMFWDKYVLRDTPPDDSLPTFETIKRIRRKPGSIIDIPKELVLARQEKKVIADQAKKAFEIVDRTLRAALGTAEIGRFDGGLVTYYEQHKRAYAVKESTYRALHVKFFEGEK